MPKYPCPFPRLRSFSLACIALFSSSLTHAQNRDAAGRTNEVSVFAALSGITPAYFPGTATGITVGLDFSHHFNRFLTPALEIRASRASNDRLIERSVLFGPLLQLNLHTRVHPYADLLLGGGTIIFLDPSVGYHEDRSEVYSFGGGVNIDLTPHFAAKLDLQGQSWNIGRQVPDGPALIFTPKLLSVGLQYSIPFRAHESRR